MKKRLTILSVVLVCFGRIVAGTDAAGIYAVGPGESYKTISSALAEMKDGDTCIIGAGVYRERIEVHQSNVTLRGVGRVVISGCDEAGEMQPVEINDRKGLKKVVATRVYDVFQDKQYLLPARYPDKTSPMTSNEDWENSYIGPEGNVELGEELGKKFPQLADGYYVGLHGAAYKKKNKLSSWYSISLPITGLGEHGYIHVDGENASSGYMGKYGLGNGLGYIIGAKAVLDAPGEWYSDGKEVILIPPANGKGRYELRTRLYGAVIKGNGVRLENIRFNAAAAWVDGDLATLETCVFEYISPFQHNPNDTPKNKAGQSLACCWGIPGNGTAGVFVKGNGFIAENCRFSKSWWCGMTVRGNNARIENCVFEDINWMAKRCAGLFSWGDGNVVRHCTLRNLGGAGIEGGNANWIGQYAVNNVWEYNYIKNVCQLIVDQGFFYVNQQSGANPPANSVWRFNVGRTAQGPRKGNWNRHVAAYYIDNSSSGFRVHNNIAIDAIHPMKHNDTQDGSRASKDIWYYNNTFYKCGSAAFGSFGDSKTRDAELHLVNNLAISCINGALGNSNHAMTFENNFNSTSASVVQNPEAADFTPTKEELKTGGTAVLGTAIPYIGAVDPRKGMWRYGADESKLPNP